MRFVLVVSALSLGFSAWGLPVYECHQPVAAGAITVEVNEVQRKVFEARVTVAGSAENTWDSGVVPVKRYGGTDGRSLLWMNKERELTILVHEETKTVEGKLEGIEVTASFVDVESGKTAMFQHVKLDCRK